MPSTGEGRARIAQGAEKGRSGKDLALTHRQRSVRALNRPRILLTSRHNWEGCVGTLTTVNMTMQLRD